jgi:hypothetical protein
MRAPQLRRGRDPDRHYVRRAADGRAAAHFADRLWDTLAQCAQSDLWWMRWRASGSGRAYPSVIWPADDRAPGRVWTMDAQDELLRAAVEITRPARCLAAQRFLEGVPDSEKPDGTEVTPRPGRNCRTRPGPPAASGLSTQSTAPRPSPTASRCSASSWPSKTRRAVRSGSESHPMSQDLIYAARDLGCWHKVNDGQQERITISTIRHPRRMGGNGQPGHLVGRPARAAAPGGPWEVLLLPNMKGMQDVALPSSQFTGHLSRCAELAQSPQL